MKIPFIKIEGLGNDYIYVDKTSFARKKAAYAPLARAISDRRHGVGSDGLIVIERLGPDSAFMTVHNSDGSLAKFCGNGLRGTALYFKTVYKSRARRFMIATRWDEYIIEVTRAGERMAIVKADLGTPSFDPRALGLQGDFISGLGIQLELNGRRRTIYCVAMPNPQTVIFVDNFDFDWQKEGAALEKSPIFKDRTNVMFVRVDSAKKLSVMPWERGSGATSACGSGAAAATVISGLLELTRGEVTVAMPGGLLKTLWDIGDNHIYQEGPTRIVFSGSYIH